MKKSKDTLGDRMKSFYEAPAASYLTRRVPVIIRVDGKAFHTFCRRFSKPYDEFLNRSLNSVMEYLCREIQGVKFAERHSDEISLLLTDFDTIKTDAYFEYGVQKICSVAASLATSEFCRLLYKEQESRTRVVNPCGEKWLNEILTMEEKWPTFDCRCFNLPENEISNYFWWRMGDAKRNSISMLAQSKFSHRELQGVSSDQMQEMLFQKHGINWAKQPQGQKIGYCCIRRKREFVIPKGPNMGQTGVRSEWCLEPSPENLNQLRKIIAGIEFRKESEEDPV